MINICTIKVLVHVTIIYKEAQDLSKFSEFYKAIVTCEGHTTTTNKLDCNSNKHKRMS